MKEGGLAILRGNVAPNGAIVRTSSIKRTMLVHRGPAKVFNSDTEGVEAIRAGRVLAGDIIVLRYEGAPRARPAWLRS